MPASLIHRQRMLAHLEAQATQAARLKPGMRIQFHGTPAMGGFPAVIGEQAVIGQWRKAISGPRMPGWHVVKFSDGGKLLAHASRFRVIDNR